MNRLQHVFFSSQIKEGHWESLVEFIWNDPHTYMHDACHCTKAVDTQTGFYSNVTSINFHFNLCRVPCLFIH